MEYINDVHDAIDKQSEEVECKWGISTMDSLQNDKIELIVAIGFKQSQL